ncbi:hypothetical protein CR513_17154, partial [Mucuna pruriens]
MQSHGGTRHGKQRHLKQKEDLVLKVTNITGTRGVTRSRRIFALESLRIKDPIHVKKDKGAEAPRRIMMKGEATEFLKLIRHSEYEMLDQLHKTPTQSHRNLLLKVLNDAHIAYDITPEKFEGIINNIITS